MRANDKSILHIGYQAENGARTIEFDFADVYNAHPGGSITIRVLLPGQTEWFPVIPQMDEVNHIATWVVSDSCLGKAGTGECQLVYSWDGGNRKSKIWQISINRALVGDGTNPPEWSDIRDEMEQYYLGTVEYAKQASSYAEQASSYAEQASSHANSAEVSAAVAETEAQAAGEKADEANTYATQADAAKAEAVEAKNEAVEAATEAKAEVESIEGKTDQINQNTADIRQHDADIAAKVDASTYTADKAVLVEDQSVQNKRIHLLEEAALGKLYTEDVEDDHAYSAAVPSGALSKAVLNEWGGKSVVWNQHADGGGSFHTFPYTQNGITFAANSDGSFTANGTATANATCFFVRPFNFIAGHKYYLSSQTADEGSETTFYSSWSLSGDEYGRGLISTANTNIPDGYVYARLINGQTVNNFVFKPVFIDLTQLYGSGNEPTTTSDPRIAEIEAYAALHPEYNSGEIISAVVDEVESADTNRQPLTTFSIPSAVLSAYPLRSAGSVYDTISYEPAVDDEGIVTPHWYHTQRVGERPYQSGDESDTSVITDGTTTIYPLTNAVRTEITDLVNWDAILDVDGGGTITYKQADNTEFAVPNEVTYLVRTTGA